uniref:Uncharacterized protein LOC113789320 n=1 Tax=Dermatophagoides pteronyssinus TaxID=6956 RepID=A0A6P6XMC3_DERPT
MSILIKEKQQKKKNHNNHYMHYDREQQTSSTITIRLERHHRGLIIECITENLRIPNSAIRDQLIIDVQYPPQMELKLGAPSLSLDSIQEGIDIYFDCHIDSNPLPTTPITWLFNGEPLQPESGIIESNQSLVLQRVQRWRNGTYQCQCSNQQGQSLSNQLKLDIKFAPVCRYPYTLIYGLQLNEIIQIICEIDSRPNTDITFQWRFEKHTNLANFIVINKTKSILEYVPRQRDQYGLIECTAKNSIGIQREPCRYLIVPVTNPYFPYECLVSNQSDSTLSIRCDGSLSSSSSSSMTNQSNLIDKESISTDKHSSSTWSTSNHHGHHRDDEESDEIFSGDSDDNDDQDDDDQKTTTRLKYNQSYRKQKSKHNLDSSLATNLTTTDIYSLYFAPDLQSQSTTGNNDDGQSSVDGGGQSIKMTYRNGIGPYPTTTTTTITAGNLQQQQRAAAVQSSILFLNELVPKFNSHSLNQQPHLLVYPPTYYICEIYSLLPRPTLIKNLTIDAIDKRIMNPLLNGSFSFLINDLPSNTPIRLNIYAQNNRKRSPIQIELQAKTLRAAERRIDFGEHHQSHDQHSTISTARGSGNGIRKTSSFFDELFGGYGRFRNKHMVVGLIISTVIITVIIALILITIAILRSKYQQQQQQQNTRYQGHHLNDEHLLTSNNSNGRLKQTTTAANVEEMNTANDNDDGNNEFIMLNDKMIHITNKQQQQNNLEDSTLNNQNIVETTFLTNENTDDNQEQNNNDDDDEVAIDNHHHHHHIRNNQMDLVEFAAATAGNNNDYGMNLIDDDNSMSASAAKRTSITGLTSHHTAAQQPPPNYYDLNLTSETSASSDSIQTNQPAGYYFSKERSRRSRSKSRSSVSSDKSRKSTAGSEKSKRNKSRRSSSLGGREESRRSKRHSRKERSSRSSSAPPDFGYGSGGQKSPRLFNKQNDDPLTSIDKRIKSVIKGIASDKVPKIIITGSGISASFAKKDDDLLKLLAKKSSHGSTSPPASTSPPQQQQQQTIAILKVPSTKLTEKVKSIIRREKSQPPTFKIMEVVHLSKSKSLRKQSKPKSVPHLPPPQLATQVPPPPTFKVIEVINLGHPSKSRSLRKQRSLSPPQLATATAAAANPETATTMYSLRKTTSKAYAMPVDEISFTIGANRNTRDTDDGTIDQQQDDWNLQQQQQQQQQQEFSVSATTEASVTVDTRPWLKDI